MLKKGCNNFSIEYFTKFYVQNKLNTNFNPKSNVRLTIFNKKAK